MTTFDFAPFYRTTVGFDRLFDLVDSSARSDWPPYNIEKKGDNDYAISMAIAGFGPEEIEITQHGTQLLVTGQRKPEQKDGRQYLHHGIAARSFKQVFNLAEHMKVVTADVANGLLCIDLVREVPEQLKPRKIEISSTGGQVGE